MFFKREALDFFIFEKKSGRLIGSVGFPRLSWALSRFELGYWLRSSCTGKGFCVEGAQALIKLAFKKLGAERIEAKINSKNKKSLRVAELCGFIYEGTLRNNTISSTGTKASTAVFSLVDLAELKKNRK
jgi:RimJ/RimL family protein N-acetyltransferase